MPIRELLHDSFGLTDEYIEARIQTVFLDGKPVDDIDTALIRDGSTLALAPAMPGLMGAMLRRGGYYAPMRSGITHRGDAAPQGIGQGRITVKLFGMALRELGPQLLERGIEVDAGDLAQIIRELPGIAGRVWETWKSSRGRQECSCGYRLLRAGRRDEGVGTSG